MLDLSENHFRNEGVTDIAKGLRSNTMLQELNLDCNDFGRMGMLSLVDALLDAQATTGLVCLSAEGNKVVPSDVNRAMDMIRLKRNIVVLRSAQKVARIGKRSALRHIPQELMRLVCDVLYSELHEEEEHSDEDDDEDEYFGYEDDFSEEEYDEMSGEEDDDEE